MKTLKDILESGYSVSIVGDEQRQELRKEMERAGYKVKGTYLEQFTGAPGDRSPVYLKTNGYISWEPASQHTQPIITWEEAKKMMYGFTKSNLKSGYKIKVRMGTEYIVFKDANASYSKDKDIAMGIGTEWISLDTHNENLKNIGVGSSNFDIVEVSKPTHIYAVQTFFTGKQLTDADFELIWKREEKDPKLVQLENEYTQLEEQLKKVKSAIEEFKGGNE